MGVCEGLGWVGWGWTQMDRNGFGRGKQNKKEN